jgi:hypothetical protein
MRSASRLRRSTYSSISCCTACIPLVRAASTIASASAFAASTSRAASSRAPAIVSLASAAKARLVERLGGFLLDLARLRGRTLDRGVRLDAGGVELALGLLRQLARVELRRLDRRLALLQALLLLARQLGDRARRDHLRDRLQVPVDLVGIVAAHHLLEGALADVDGERFGTSRRHGVGGGVPATEEVSFAP